MWTFESTIQTDVRSQSLWDMLIRIDQWPRIDRQWRTVIMEDESRAGASFWLKPARGLWELRTISAFYPCSRFATTHAGWILESKTSFMFYKSSHGSDIDLRIELKGPLLPLVAPIFGPLAVRSVTRFVHRLIDAAHRESSHLSHDHELRVDNQDLLAAPHDGVSKIANAQHPTP